MCVISGPAEVKPPAGAEVVEVLNAADMYEAVMARVDACDVFIAAAAVADYRAENVSSKKLKRSDENVAVALTSNPDIVATMASKKRPGCKVVGFAAESDDILVHAAAKLKKKHLDMIVANAVGGEKDAIGADASEAWLLLPNQGPESQGCIKKAVLASRIFDRIRGLQ